MGAAGGKIKTVLQPSATNPLVAIRLYFKVGSADDPKGKEGLAALTAAMLGEGGTKTRSYAEVLDALYPLAAQIAYYGDKESVVFNGTVHRDNLQTYAQLIAEQVLQPAFAEEDFRRNRQDALDYITKTLRGNDDETLGKRALGAVLYRGHPYAHPALGTVAGLEAITLDDVKKFYAELLHPRSFDRRGRGRLSRSVCQRVRRAFRWPARQGQTFVAAAPRRRRAKAPRSCWCKRPRRRSPSRSGTRCASPVPIRISIR